MPEYIDRNKAVDAIADTMVQGFIEDRFITPRELQNLQDELECLPAADVAPVVHGRWVDRCGRKECVCSCCKTSFDHTNQWIERWNYCPNCGAKMDLEAHHE